MVKEILEILQPGPMTTIQDRGRFGFRKFGVPVSGALDGFSSVIANRLTGARDDAPVLEMTLSGPKMAVLSDCVISVTGAQMPLKVNGIEKPLWATVSLARGDIVQFGVAVKGLRAYLAVGGGIWCPRAMGSSSTFAAAGLGGMNGRRLLGGDRLLSSEPTNGVRSRMLDRKFRPELCGELKLRSLPGPQDDFFNDGLETFFSAEYTVTGKTDRMGCRLDGSVVTFRDQSRLTIISEPSLPGCVQVPPDGQPIILLVEQTVGGYAKIATVISADLDLVAQARPGDRIRFTRVSHLQAVNALRERKSMLESIAFTNL